MAQSRETLHQFLLDLPGEHKAYFQQPEDGKMSYPCFVYDRDGVNTDHADNRPYRTAIRYQLSYITDDPDDPMINILNNLPRCAHVRHFVTDQLHHDIYNFYH